LQVNLSLDPTFLYLTLDSLNKQLERGYMLHVKGFTVHFLLDALHKEGTLETGLVDNCIDAIGKVVVDEEFGKLSQSKSVEDTGKKLFKESKSRRGHITYEILSQHIDFKNSFTLILKPLTSILESTPAAAQIAQIENLLGKIGTSILKNLSLDADTLFSILFQMITTGIEISQSEMKEEEPELEPEEYKKPRLRDLEYQTAKVLPRWLKGKGQYKNSKLSGKVLAGFGLSTMKKSLKVVKIGEHRERIEPFCK
jgi:U3 small nucleolar RNA-associated protein 20